MHARGFQTLPVRDHRYYDLETALTTISVAVGPWMRGLDRKVQGVHSVVRKALGLIHPVSKTAANGYVLRFRLKPPLSVFVREAIRD